MTINGIGTRFLGYSNLDEEGCYTAYQFFTFLFLPIFPIHKWRMKRALSDHREFNTTFLEKLPMKGVEIMGIYLRSLILYPALIFWPFPIAVREVYFALNLPRNYYDYFVGFAIVYFIVVIWILFNRYERQGLPKNYKTLLRENPDMLDD